MDCSCTVILRPWFRTRNGRVVYAWSYGKRAFTIHIRCDDHKRTG